MKPENVNPGNYKLDCVLFNNNFFSISYGFWENEKKCLAMRWNGENNDPGYPKVFGNPMWFIIDDNLRVPFIQSLIGQPNSNKENILKVLNELI